MDRRTDSERLAASRPRRLDADGGADIRFIQELLGHESLTATRPSQEKRQEMCGADLCVPLLAIVSCGAGGGDWVFTLEGPVDPIVETAAVSVCGSSHALRRTDGQWSVRAPVRCEGAASLRIVKKDRSEISCNAGYVTTGFKQTRYAIRVSDHGCQLLGASAK